ncbi:LOW QUALITY PROTEIN: uncharacterized protein ColSpa_05408 [Colletotrichum spaethianum]|uniref:Uncharacterized protein n=1 Tax=Colletotrichum spaethianum TaxID=700344 RepID=A0AA37LB50_9PEZI|nr:LOW QUALITY PROTEIN: uncharacterized protein ColSpa_05408 [Colletotrichum spaethianum]GKT45227.1 LOW QUALITY PROTEIN: hypothetical protein ColSpa_05408 [Colletotrichum spaethianum]
MRKYAAWRVIESLCDQAMLYHKQRSHKGAWYSQRLDLVQTATTAQRKSSMALENATVDDILGDVQMFGQDASQHGAPAILQHKRLLEPWDILTGASNPILTGKVNHIRINHLKIAKTCELAFRMKW